MTLTQMQLDWLLQGLDIQAIKPHKNIPIYLQKKMGGVL